MLFVNLVGRQTSVKTTYKTFAVWVGFMKKVFGRRNNVRQQKILLNKWNIFLYSWRPSHAISKSNEKFSLFFFIEIQSLRRKITDQRLLMVVPAFIMFSFYYWSDLMVYDKVHCKCLHTNYRFIIIFRCCYYTWKCVKGL